MQSAEIAAVRTVPVQGFSRGLIVVVCVASFFSLPSFSQVSWGTLIGLAAAPLWWNAIRNDAAARRVAILLLAVTFLFVPTSLISLAMDSSRSFVLENALREVFGLIAMLTFFVATFVSTRWNGPRLTLLALGAGGGISAALYLTPEQSDNAWKYAFVWPVGLLVLALVARWNGFAVAVIFFALSAMSLFFESRNAAGAFAVAGLVCIVYQLLSSRTGRSRSRVVSAAVAIAAATLLAYSVITAAIADGTFGAELQQRQIRQDLQGPFGARVEWAATLGLLQRSVFGLGAGVSPGPKDVQTGLESLYDNGFDANTDYVTSHLLGSRVELHSIVGDFWLNGGPIAFCIGIYFGVLLVRSLVQATHSPFRSVVALLSVQALWDLVFSPMVVNGKWVAIALAVCLALSAPRLKGKASVERDRHERLDA
ncbi:hypothetical protein [Leifsonia sp. Leaf264]|uniref:hypothetical protein n=1 Tax=Leifsonia sp. Leaf264 TaxID=1736314 RepID=UPI0006F76BC5|nr:hypothetical protein [Leifsonia sp. Leaf264]KQO95414.1 hypothetical protein ASF30_20570 [Leifsonia sp. Leaf264]